jgi:hypothetical protein
MVCEWLALAPCLQRYKESVFYFCQLLLWKAASFFEIQNLNDTTSSNI